MNSFLFNFSSSYSGGGLKRLLAYLKWFDDNGGGYFIINHKAKSLLPNSKHNVCYYISPSKVKKALNNQDY